MDNNTQNNSLSQTSIDTDLVELKNIEGVITSQLNELGEKIDSSFSKAAQIVGNVTDFASSFAKTGTARDTIQFVGMTVSSAVKGVGDAYNAYKHNQALDALLVQKQKIAKAKRGAIDKVLPRLQHLAERYTKLLDNFTVKDYKVEILHHESYAKPLYNNLDKSLNMLRAVLYNQAMAEYILAEYNAWLGGEQQSELLQPTFWDINKMVAEHLGNPDALELIDKYSLQTEGEIKGSEACFLHDGQLMSQAMSENSDKMLGRLWPSDEEIEDDLKTMLGDDVKDEEARQEALKEILKDGPAEGKPLGWCLYSMDKMKQNNSALLPSPDFFDKYLEEGSQYSTTYEEMKKNDKYLHVMTLVWLMLDYVLLIDADGLIGDWATWLRWVFGIIAAIVVLSVWEGWLIPLNNKPKHQKLTELADDIKGSYGLAAGYEHIEKKILKKKDVVGSFLSNFK